MDGVDQLDLVDQSARSGRRAFRRQIPRTWRSLATSAAIANAQLGGADTAIAIATFVAIGSITVVGAVAYYLATPATAAKPLASVKQFMADNNATIMMVILVILGAELLGDALAGVWS